MEQMVDNEPDRNSTRMILTSEVERLGL